jgi:hypothetical protein
MQATPAENEPSPRCRWWHWLVPSLTQYLWLALFVALLVQPQRTKLVSGDADACMHWRVGEHMLQTGEIIRQDVFSHTRHGDRFISKEWLSQVIYALAGRVGGLTGLSIFAALVIATTFALLHRQLLREGTDILVATLLVLLAAWASASHWHARPHVFSFLLLLGWNQALRQYERGGTPLRLAVSLGVLTVLWVNLHGAYLAGFLVLGCYWLGATVDFGRLTDGAARAAARSRLRTLSWVIALCAGVSLLNPNGYELHTHNLGFLRSEYFVSRIDEYQSQNFHEASARGVIAWLAAMAFAFVVCRPRVSASAAILTVAWSYFALYSVRNISLWAILTAPILASAIAEKLRAGSWPAWSRLSSRVERVHSTGRAGPLMVVLVVAILFLAPLPTQMPEDRWPVAGVAHIRAHPERFEGRMFNESLWGSYLLQALPEHTVFADTRFDFYGEALYRDYDEVTGVGPDWEATLSRYEVAWTLLPTKFSLNQVLAVADGWEPEYADPVATIYRKRVSVAAGGETGGWMFKKWLPLP